MTIDLIERMARAIYEDRNGAGCVPWSRRDAAHKKPYRADALAVLKALREPSWPAQVAGRDAILAEDDSLDISTDDARACWIAMIGAEIAAAEAYRND